MNIRPYARNVAYIAISAIFFSFWIIITLLPLIRIGPDQHQIPYFGTNIIAAVFFLLGLISVSGAIAFLADIKNEIRKWYLGVPLAVTIGVVTGSYLLSPVLPGYFGYPVNTGATVSNLITGQVAVYLIAPFSALFFYSLKEIKGLMRVPILVTLAVSILFSGCLFIESSMHDISMFYLLYLEIGMPLVGAMFLATCTELRKPGLD
jgi:hypothetical protein